jgi:hypothetical protein
VVVKVVLSDSVYVVFDIPIPAVPLTVRGKVKVAVLDLVPAVVLVE